MSSITAEVAPQPYQFQTPELNWALNYGFGSTDEAGNQGAPRGFRRFQFSGKTAFELAGRALSYLPVVGETVGQAVSSYSLADFPVAGDYLGKSQCEALMEFLILHGRPDVAQHIADDVKKRIESYKITNLAISPEREKLIFFQSVLAHAHRVFAVYVPRQEVGESDQDYKQRLEKYFKGENFHTKDLPYMHQFKKLVNKAAFELGFESPDLQVFGDRTKFYGIKVDMADDSADQEFLSKLRDLNNVNLGKNLFELILRHSGLLVTTENLEANTLKHHINQLKQVQKRLLQQEALRSEQQQDLDNLNYVLAVIDKKLTETSRKRVDFTDSEEVAKRLVKMAMANRTQEFITPLSYERTALRPLTEELDTSKQEVRTWKDRLFYTLVGVASVIGVGELFAPAGFWYSMMLSLGFTGVIPAMVFGVVAVAAFSVNFPIFRDHSYGAFTDLLFKGRFFKDAKGRDLPWYLVARNFVAFSLAVFSAFTISGLSFFFSGFAAPIALFISAMTFVGFTGVLTSAMMGVLQMKTLNSFLDYLYDLIVTPLLAFWNSMTNFSIKDMSTSLIEFVVNGTAVAAMALFAVSVLAATSAMFYVSLMGIPLLATGLGAMGVATIVGVAEVALGTFFIKNIGKFINFVRSTLLDAPAILVDKLSGLFGAQAAEAQNTDVANANQDHPIRQAAVNFGQVAALALGVFAFVNASGFAVGYFTTIATHAAVVSALGLGMFTPAILLFAAPILATMAYTMASVGGNAAAGAEAVVAPDTLHQYTYDFAARVAKEYKAVVASRVEPVYGSLRRSLDTDTSDRDDSRRATQAAPGLATHGWRRADGGASAAASYSGSDSSAAARSSQLRAAG